MRSLLSLSLLLALSACRGPSAAPGVTLPAPLPPREASSVDATPRVTGDASIALLRKLAAEPRIDPIHGLAVVAAGPSPNDRPDHWSEKLCGDEAREELGRRLSAYLAQDDQWADEDRDHVLTCSGLVCTKEPTMEWDPAVTIQLSRTNDGDLVVSQILGVDVLLRADEDGIASDSAWAQAEGARLATETCR